MKKFIGELLCMMGFHKKKFIPGAFEYPREHYLCKRCGNLICKNTNKKI
jgi:hypothetical protein